MSIVQRNTGANVTAMGSFYDYSISSSDLTNAGEWMLRVELNGIQVGGDANLVFVSSATPYLSKSTFQCPSEVPYLATAHCTIVLSDKYGNVVSPSTSALSLFSPSIVPKEEIDVRVGGNAYLVQFRPVSLTDSLKISVNYAGFETLGRSLRIGATQNVTVRRVTLGNETRMECGAMTVPVVAGTSSVCTVEAFDNKGAPVREPAFGAAFSPTVLNEGVPLATVVTFDQTTGKYSVQYTPTSSGQCTVRISYAANRTYLADIGGLFTYNIVPGPVLPSMSTYRCDKLPIVPGGSVHCAIRTRDKFNNIAGDADTAHVFYTRASFSIGGHSTVYRIGADFIKKGEYSVSLRLIYIGEWTIGINYDGAVIHSSTTGITDPVSIVVNPGPYALINTTVSCVGEAPSSSLGTCYIRTFDVYGNPAQETSAVAKTFRVQTDPNPTFNVEPTEGGVYMATFSTPVLSTILQVQMYAIELQSNTVNVLPIGSSHNVTVVQTRLSHNLTTAECDTSVEAGSIVTCRLEAYDDSGALVTIPALSAAFHVQIEGNTEIVTGTKYPVEYTGPGEFTVTIVAKRAGTIKTMFLYRDSSGLSSVGSSSSSSGGGNYQHVTTIIPGLPAASNSISKCAPQPVSASNDVSCIIMIRDEYNNSAVVRKKIASVFAGTATMAGSDPILHRAPVVFLHQYQILTLKQAAASMSSTQSMNTRHVTARAAQKECDASFTCTCIVHFPSTATLPLCENDLGCYEPRSGELVKTDIINAPITTATTTTTTIEHRVYEKLLTGDVDLGQVQITFPALKFSGHWQMATTFNSEKVGRSSPIITVVAESPNAATSTYIAPNTVPASATARILIHVRDIYSNPTSLESANQLRLDFTPFLPFKFSQVQGSNSSWIVTFETPALASNITVDVALLDAAGTPIKIGTTARMEVVQTQLSTSNTTTTCSSTSVVAGTPIVCTLSAVDADGVAVVVPGLAPAFIVSARGTSDNLGQQEVTFSATSSKYISEFVPTTGKVVVFFSLVLFFVKGYERFPFSIKVCFSDVFQMF